MAEDDTKDTLARDGESRYKLEPDRSKSDYWNWRVRTEKDEERIIWYGQKWKWDAMDLLSRHILSLFQGCSVLDVGCGYGRMATLFSPENYHGIDFSEEMIALAKSKYPGYSFELGNKDDLPKRKYGVIFSVMSGPIPHMKDYAEIALVEIGSGEARITYNLS